MEESSNVEEGKRKFTTFEIRPYKITELARIYRINVQTFKKWIGRFRRKLGQIIGHYLTITQVEIIIAHLRLPYFIQVEVLSEEKIEQVLEEKMKRLPEPLPQASTSANVSNKKTTNHKMKKSKAVKKPVRKK